MYDRPGDAGKHGRGTRRMVQAKSGEAKVKGGGRESCCGWEEVGMSGAPGDHKRHMGRNGERKISASLLYISCAGVVGSFFSVYMGWF